MQTNNNEKFGYLNLAKKSLAVIAASLTALIPNRSNALPQSTNFDTSGAKLDFKTFQKQILKSKLVLKISSYNPDKFLLAMHTSHASHSSHASHASHSSHYSSSSDYSPSDSTKVPTPNKTTKSESLPDYQLGSRLLNEGCEGTDVQELQQMLVKLGYNVSVTGYYGGGCSAAVKKFQNSQDLKPSGQVDKKTLNFLRNKLNGN
jgi:murein L,D-transpeptidase YcbB/YkuD